MSFVLISYNSPEKIPFSYCIEDLGDDDDIEGERRALSVHGNVLARRFSRCSVNVKRTLLERTATIFIQVHCGPTSRHELQTPFM